jgi:hypothetical protein
VKRLGFILLVFCACNLQAQNLVLNGSFEDHTAPDCYNNFNLTQWNSTVVNSTQYNNGWVALLNDSCVTCGYLPNYYWGGGSQEGHWFATVRSNDFYNQGTGVTTWLYSRLSLALDSALKNTTNYKLSFYIKDPDNYPTDTTPCYDVAGNYLKVGISNNATNFGTHLITTPLGTDDWQQYSVVFNTTNAEQHLTIEVGTGDTNNYVLFIDNFVIEETSEPATVFVTATNEMPQQEKKLVKIVDVLGRESKPKKNTALFYIYRDGTVEKRIVIE